MKHFFSKITSLLILILSLAACQPEQGQEIMTQSTISLEVMMPEKMTLDGVKGSMAYYWNKQLQLQLEITQEGKTPKNLSLTPEKILGEGDKANFNIVIDTKEFDLSKPLTLSGTVASSKPLGESEGQYQLVMPKGYGGLLPYNLLRDINSSLKMEPVTVNLNNQGKHQASTSLAAEGQFILLQLLNGYGESISTESFRLKQKGEDSKISELALKTRLTPEYSTNLLLWIAPEMANEVEMEIGYQNKEGETLSSKVEFKPDRSKALSLIFCRLTSSGTPEISDKPIVEEADVSEGGDPLFTMDDIQFWVGEGENRAALVIEWHDDKQPDALVWGYRWDGEKTGFDMVKAVLKADPRLSALMGKAFGGLEVIGGLGYQFKATSPRAHVILPNTDGTQTKMPNDGNGITYVPTAKDFDSFIFSDPKGHWQCGWYDNGYWVYYVKDTRLDSWAYSQLVYSLRVLVDGCWDGWSFQEGMESYVGRPHGNKFIAAPLPE